VGTDRHSRPTATLASDELLRLARQEETPVRVPKSSDQMRRERLDTPTTQMSAVALDELLAAEPRTTPAVIPREALRHDTVTDAGAKPTTALDPETVAELAAARTAQELEAAAPTVAMEPFAKPEGRRSKRGAIARPALPGGPSVRLPFLIAAIAAVAVAVIVLLR
jgi:hypothetical protein